MSMSSANRKRRSEFFLLIVIWLTPIMGCGGLVESENRPVKGNLDRASASQLIKKWPKFNEALSITVCEGDQMGYDCEPAVRGEVADAEQMLSRLQQMGILTYTGGKFLERLCQVKLTQEGRRLSGNWERSGPNCWKIAVADRQLIEVTGVLGGDKESAQAEFTWQWNQTDFGRKVASALRQIDKRQGGSATFQKYDDGWRVVGASL